VDSTKPENLISYTNIEVDGNVLENIGDYKADGDISFNIGQDYTDVDGIVTFRGNSFRDTPSHGYADMTDFRLNKLWSADTGSLSSGRVDHIGVRPQCGQLKPRTLIFQYFWAYILHFFTKTS